MHEIHPLIKALASSFYGGGSLKKQIEEFLKDFENVTGYRIDVQNPDAGIFWFVKKKWGLPFDALIHFAELREKLRKKKHKNLKKDSIGVLIGSVIIQSLKLLEKEVDFKAKLNYKTQSLDVKNEVIKFKKKYPLNKDILTFETLKDFLEKLYIPVFALPLDKKSEEGICNPDKYPFVIINSQQPKPLSGFLLAHELGHLIFNGNASEEENFANKFGTYLVISSSAGEQIKEIFRKSLISSDNIHNFIKPICQEFSCKIHPKTALAFLFYEGIFDRKKFEVLQMKIEKYIKRQEKNKSKLRVNWLKTLVEPQKIYISKTYEESLIRLYEEGKINQERKKELLLEDYLRWAKESSAVIPL